MRINELKRKEVINICDGMLVGRICDVEFEFCDGKMTHIVVPGPCKILGIFGRDEEYVIPVSCIKRIGPEIVIIEVDLQKCINAPRRI